MNNPPIQLRPGELPPRTLLSVQEVAQILDIPLGLVMRHIETGVLRAIRYANHLPVVPEFIVRRALDDPNFPRKIGQSSPGIIYIDPVWSTPEERVASMIAHATPEKAEWIKQQIRERDAIVAARDAEHGANIK